MHSSTRRPRGPSLRAARSAVWRAATVVFLSGLCAALPGGVHGAGPPALLEAASDVDRVLVYSDQARVLRKAVVTLRGGVAQVAAATLPHSALRDSLRVSCQGAEVLGVEVHRTRQRLQRQQRARELLEQIERIDGQLGALRDEERALTGEIGYIDSLDLGVPPRSAEARQPVPAVFVSAWRAILSWSESRAARARRRLLAIGDERRRLGTELHKVKTEARSFEPGRVDEPAWQVVVRLRGSGRKQLELSYLVSGVRWVPSYDLRYEPGQGTVQAAYYALVRQRTGEDWSRAALRFSTALPTELLAVPELPTWTLGRRRDFTPRPSPRREPALQPWQPPEEPVASDPLAEQLRAAVAQRPTDKDVGEDPVGARDRQVQYKKRTVHRFDGTEVVGELQRPDGEFLESRRRVAKLQSVPGPAPPPSPVSVAATGSQRMPPSEPGRARWGRSEPASESVPWTDVGYRPRALDPDLPAAAAEGYRFTLRAPGRHRIAGDGADQRIPLSRRALSVRAVHRIVPGRSDAAYVLGTLRNSTGKPILRGHANLFAGTMYAGRSWLNTALPGRELQLPLGVDDQVRVVRHLRQRTVSQGVVLKDDVTEYTVAIEIANHHRRAIDVELEDQVPLQLGDKVEVKAFVARPAMEKPDRQGRVRWRGEVAGGAVKKLSFSFQLVRPKDWELRQHD